MDTHYPADAELMQRLPAAEREAFEQWIVKLDEAHFLRRSPYGDGPLAKLTGLECWYSSFKDGDDPGDALDEDLSYAE